MNEKPLYPWLQEIATRLMRLHWQQRLPHAILLSGAQGIGKSSLHDHLEKFYLCQHPQQQSACGVCRACCLYQAQNHPDYLHVRFTDKSINIENIREINALLSQTPHQNGRFVIRIDEINQLQMNAANALLKILEEPQKNTLFLLTSSQKAILPTLKSRCFTVNIPIPPQKQALAWLQKAYPDKSHEHLQKCLTIAGGAPGMSIRLLSIALEKYPDMLFKILFEEQQTLLYDEELQRFFTTSALEALYFIYYWLTECVRFSLAGDTDFSSNPFADEKFKKYQSVVSAKKIFLFLDKINEAIKTIVQPGINKLLIFESLFYQWQTMNLRGKYT